ncbi:MAG: hypothetical protein JRI68_30140, partial [Deltaproteobacteria bacterium]|nr:hypothetical protein [Deltaproteobacteria bacterium]
MGTYLTNSKMGPELRARIEASVTGRRGPSRTVLTPRVRAVVRIAVLLVVAGALFAFVRQWRESSHELDQAKAALLADLDRLRGARQPRGEPLVRAVGRWLSEAAKVPGDELLDPSLREPAALASLLDQPLVYLRAPAGAVTAPSWLGRLEPDPAMDAFVACLLSPPAGRAERDLVAMVEAAYRGGAALAKETAQAHRLQVVVLAKPFFEDSWRELVQDARTVSAVAELRLAMEQAHLERAAQVERAGLLVYLLDEPKKAGTASELDGASEHVIRLGIVDLAAATPLLRIRRLVDPSWISEARR